jgi:hypothetical protein
MSVRIIFIHHENFVGSTTSATIKLIGEGITLKREKMGREVAFAFRKKSRDIMGSSWAEGDEDTDITDEAKARRMLKCLEGYLDINSENLDKFDQLWGGIQETVKNVAPDNVTFGAGG